MLITSGGTKTAATEVPEEDKRKFAQPFFAKPNDYWTAQVEALLDTTIDILQQDPQEDSLNKARCIFPLLDNCMKQSRLHHHCQQQQQQQQQ